MEIKKREVFIALIIETISLCRFNFGQIYAADTNQSSPGLKMAL